RPGNHLSDISHTVQKHVEHHGFSVVRALVGHGIGRMLHEEPQIPNFGPPGKGPVLKPGMVLAIEPMVNVGTHDILTLKDNWTFVTVDGKLSAHFEDTVAVTEKDPLIMTR
ncbi:MAG: M24 family metallopeptidase, partial [Candidatus Krumholzibacteria bacterium]|nr:M24 family metallopeptidase [Candidatus Krumholzibacteria bacterium]